jgi:sulfonate transport system substrate-binding protein
MALLSFARLVGVITLAMAVNLTARANAADKVEQITIDYAYYNPVSLVLKDKGWMEDEFKKDGITVRWVQSLGSNKALEFLNGNSIDFGSSAGAAALLARINGNPVKSIYVYSKPEWTALVTAKDSTIQKVEDLRGKRVAATRGTDPHIFLIRALADHGLSEKDVHVVLLQHQDGRMALEKGDVDAWAGLDPLMAQAEIDSGARLFYRNADLNTLGVLDTRESFAAQHPEIVERVLKVYEKGRAYALANPVELRKIVAAQAKLSEEVAARQLERTDLSSAVIDDGRRRTILGAGLALQNAGVVPTEVNVPDSVAQLIDTSFTTRLGIK